MYHLDVELGAEAGNRGSGVQVAWGDMEERGSPTDE